MSYEETAIGKKNPILPDRFISFVLVLCHL
jgi:hypothetical protein